MDQLELFRKKIDSMDRQILELLSRRFTLCRKIALYKKEKKIKVRQKNREIMALGKRITSARKYRMPPGFAGKLFTLIFRESRLRQNTLYKDKEL